MSKAMKTGYGSALTLFAFGVLALCLDPRWLAILIPAAVLVWYEASPMARGGRN